MPRGRHLVGSSWTFQRNGRNGSHRACGEHTLLLGEHVASVEGGHMKCPEAAPPPPPPPAVPVPHPLEPLELPKERVLRLRSDADALAHENGLVGVLDIDEPVKVTYPVWGHGWSVGVRERAGLQRAATARFDAAGKPSFWSMDRNTV